MSVHEKSIHSYGRTQPEGLGFCSVMSAGIAERLKFQIEIPDASTRVAYTPPATMLKLCPYTAGEGSVIPQPLLSPLLLAHVVVEVCRPVKALVSPVSSVQSPEVWSVIWLVVESPTPSMICETRQPKSHWARRIPTSISPPAGQLGPTAPR